MSFKAILGDILPKYIRLSKTEAKILDTIITVKSGNAYSLWKASGLKHYPTVLRTLKKLEEKRLVQKLSESGTRGERMYTPTLLGTLVSHIFNGEKKKIIKIVAENSSLFRELSKIEDVDYYAFRAVQEIVLDAYRKTAPRGIDESFKNCIEWALRDTIVNPFDEGNPEWIMKVSKVKRVRQLAIRLIEEEIDWCKREIEELSKLKERLTAK